MIDNHNVMKRKLLFAAGLFCMTISFNSCDPEDCEVCRQTTRDIASGDILSETSETEYCGAELLTIKATAAVNVGGKRTKWECR